LPEPKTILFRFSHSPQRRQSPMSSMILASVSPAGASGGSSMGEGAGAPAETIGAAISASADFMAGARR